MPFGQIVIGPPGSGKSTYCNGCSQFFNAIGRHARIVNMDPANDKLPYPCEVDIRDFITLEEIMNEQHLGPNGGLMYALESVEKSLSLFVLQIEALVKEENAYLVFDCPGQVELFTHNSALSNIFKKLEKTLDFRFCVVNLVDSIYLSSPSQYISVLLLALRSMLMMDLPHVNVFSKIDMVSSYGELPFRLDYYTDAQDLEFLQPHVEKESKGVLGKRYGRLTEIIGDLVADYNLVSFEVLCVDDRQSMISLQGIIDKANGYVFGASEVAGDTVWAEATRQGVAEVGHDIQDRWIDNKELYDKAEEEQRELLVKEQLRNDKEINVNEEEEWDRAIKEWDQQHSVPFKK